MHRVPASPEWQRELREAVTSGERLLEMLGLQAADAGFSPLSGRDFPLKVPLPFVRRMARGNPRDPLLLQVLAHRRELEETPGYGADPVGESGAANPRRGVIHKYHGRVLLILSGGCAVNCRYCFRRHFPYADHRNSRDEWREALGYIAADAGIREVILSGGDPLLVADDHLGDLVSEIAAIPHVRRLRVHTRLPVVIPSRVTPGLCDALRRERLQSVVVIHCNHANEIDAQVASALAALREHGITLLNQAVLLAGINDSPQALIGLSEKLFAAGVLPYYLHLLDRVQGAAHFDVPEERARELLARVSAGLPGYLVPKLVREVAGAPAKLQLL
jgi:EF-P beta-lysylation protein EpmB